jgi:ferritin-like metal-binding protein YciE
VLENVSALEVSSETEDLKEAVLKLTQANKELAFSSLLPHINREMQINTSNQHNIEGRIEFIENTLKPALEIIATSTFDYLSSLRNKDKDKDMLDMLAKLIPEHERNGAVEQFKIALDQKSLLETDKRLYAEITRDLLICYALTRPYSPNIGLKYESDKQSIREALRVATEIDEIMGFSETSKIAKLVLERRVLRAENNIDRITEIESELETLTPITTIDYYAYAKLLHAEKRQIDKADKLYVKALEELKILRASKNNNYEADYFRMIEFGLHYSRGSLLNNVGRRVEANGEITSCYEISRTIANKTIADKLQAQSLIYKMGIISHLDNQKESIDKIFEEVIKLDSSNCAFYWNYFMLNNDLVEQIKILEQGINNCQIETIPNYYLAHYAYLKLQAESTNQSEAIDIIKTILKNNNVIYSNESVFLKELKDFLNKNDIHTFKTKLDLQTWYNISAVIADWAKLDKDDADFSLKIEISFLIIENILTQIENDLGYGKNAINLEFPSYEILYKQNKQRFMEIFNRYKKLPDSELKYIFY